LKSFGDLKAFISYYSFDQLPSCSGDGLMADESQTAFISYSREDSEFALKLAGDLKAGGAAVWLDQLDIAPGQRWARAVQDALNECPRMLVILSPASASSTNVDDEVSFALEEKKTVIPVIYRECKIPFRLRPFQYVDFRSDYDAALKRLLRTLPAELIPASAEIPPTVLGQVPQEQLAESERREEQVQEQPSAPKQPISATVHETQASKEREHVLPKGPEQIEKATEVWEHKAGEPPEPITSNAESASAKRIETVIPAKIRAVPSPESEPREDRHEARKEGRPVGENQRARALNSSVPARPEMENEPQMAEEQGDLTVERADLYGQRTSAPIEPGHAPAASDQREALLRQIPRQPVWVGVTALCVILLAGLTWYWISLTTRSWKPQKSGTSEYLNSVFFTTDLSGWVVGSSGVILHTKDGGKTWEPQSSGTNERLRSVVFSTRESGWVAGDDGLILHTEDGRTWKPQTSGAPQENLVSVFFSTPQSGWVTGTNGTIVHTEDGGNTWKSQVSGSKSWLWSVVFPTDSSGWIVGYDGTVLHTDDGGNTWKKEDVGTKDRLMSITFSAAQSGWIAGPIEATFHTDDGGLTWNKQNNSIANLNSVSFVSPKLGWAAGYGGTIIHTDDGGASWKEQASGTHAVLNSVVFTTPHLGWAVGEAGVILHTDDGGGKVK